MSKRKGQTGIEIRCPKWVSDDIWLYLAHTRAGAPIRALARQTGCHASTVLRKIRRIELRRDDNLVDQALDRLGQLIAPLPSSSFAQEKNTMTPMPPPTANCADAQDALSEERLKQEARRILRRLTESGAVLAVAHDLEKAVVARSDGTNESTKTAVVDRAIAEAMALKGWITCANPGKISRYGITSLGRVTLTRLIAEAENAARQLAYGEAGNPITASGMAEAMGRFSHRDSARTIQSPPRKRATLTESPLISLSRRREKDGTPFLTADLVRVGERLREDFELSQMGPQITQNWDHFLTGSVRGTLHPDGGTARGAEAARNRVAGALAALGPGLGDVVLRCCCYLEGLEATEKRMGWSSRSGKVVLRIALQRLKFHYENLGARGHMIG